MGGQTNGVANREIRSGIRVFQILGWTGAIIYTPMVVGRIATLVYSVLVEPKESLLVLVGASLFNGLVLFYFLCLLRSAFRRNRREPDAIRSAKVLSYVTMIGFPLFTVVGILVVRKLNRHCQGYCRYRLDR